MRGIFKGVVTVAIFLSVAVMEISMALADSVFLWNYTVRAGFSSYSGDVVAGPNGSLGLPTRLEWGPSGSRSSLSVSEPIGRVAITDFNPPIPLQPGISLTHVNGAFTERALGDANLNVHVTVTAIAAHEGFTTPTGPPGLFSPGIRGLELLFGETPDQPPWSSAAAPAATMF